jgi:hypothetical protein
MTHINVQILKEEKIKTVYSASDYDIKDCVPVHNFYACLNIISGYQMTFNCKLNCYHLHTLENAYLVVYNY